MGSGQPRQWATKAVILRCREILREVGPQIPHFYVKAVQEAFAQRGLVVPSRIRITAVRHGNAYDLAIVKVLRELSLTKVGREMGERAKACRKILGRIDEHIPFKYAFPVQDLFIQKGVKPPSLSKIRSVRNGKQYDLEIMKALQEVSQPRDENDELVKPPKWEVEPQTKIFDEEKEVV